MKWLLDKIEFALPIIYVLLIIGVISFCIALIFWLKSKKGKMLSKIESICQKWAVIIGVIMMFFVIILIFMALFNDIFFTLIILLGLPGALASFIKKGKM